MIRPYRILLFFIILFAGMFIAAKIKNTPKTIFKKEMAITKIIQLPNHKQRIFLDKISDSTYVDVEEDAYQEGQKYFVTYNSKTGVIDGFQVNQNERKK